MKFFGDTADVAEIEDPAASGLLGTPVATRPSNVLRQRFKHGPTDNGLAAFLDDRAKTGPSIL